MPKVVTSTMTVPAALLDTAHAVFTYVTVQEPGAQPGDPPVDVIKLHVELVTQKRIDDGAGNITQVEHRSTHWIPDLVAAPNPILDATDQQRLETLVKKCMRACRRVDELDP